MPLHRSSATLDDVEDNSYTRGWHRDVVLWRLGTSVVMERIVHMQKAMEPWRRDAILFYKYTPCIRLMNHPPLHIQALAYLLYSLHIFSHLYGVP